MGAHKYPNPIWGQWYGFPVTEIREALERGDSKREDDIVDIGLGI